METQGFWFFKALAVISHIPKLSQVFPSPGRLFLREYKPPVKLQGGNRAGEKTLLLINMKCYALEPRILVKSIFLKPDR